MFEFASLLYKNLRGREMLSRFLYLKKKTHFDTEEVIIQQKRKQKYYFDSTIDEIQS
jgi:hypothetical protein